LTGAVLLILHHHHLIMDIRSLNRDSHTSLRHTLHITPANIKEKVP
jgi:hypothetical protein